MINQKKQILISLISGEISKEDFIRQYSLNEIIDDKYCLKLFKEAFDNKDSERVEEAVILGNTFNCFSSKLSEVLCNLLLEDWHFKHEDIAGILQRLKDSSTVNCLFNAIRLRFDYLDYDDTYQFARKCIKALAAIDTSEAIHKIQSLTQSNIPEIRQYALKELNYREKS